MGAPQNRLFLSLAEAARLVGCARSTLDVHARRGELDYISTSLGRLFPLEAVEAFKAERDLKRSLADA